MAVEASTSELVKVVALLGAAVVMVPLFRRAGLGSVLGYFAAGLAIGPFGLGWFSDPQAILHTAELGQYRPPHDHGSGWVLYAVGTGTMEMSTYHRAVNPKGELHLVRRETYQLQPGDCRAFLPEDIHETRCLSERAILLRFTSCDLREEERAGRIIRYPQPPRGE